MVSPADLNAARQSGAASVGTIDINNLGGDSLQLMFAKLQLALAESAKSNAMEYINDIRKTQEEQKLVAAFLQEARQSQDRASHESEANKTESGEKESTMMSVEMENYLKENKLAYDSSGNSRRQNKDEWNVAITSLQARLDSLGTDTQQKMVFVQDFMGQYNSYLQGANSVIQQSNQTLGELARTR
jgi:hypothetical protein